MIYLKEKREEPRDKTEKPQEHPLHQTSEVLKVSKPPQRKLNPKPPVPGPPLTATALLFQAPPVYHPSQICANARVCVARLKLERIRWEKSQGKGRWRGFVEVKQVLAPRMADK